MAKGKKTGGRDFQKGDPRRMPNARKGTAIPADVLEALKLLDQDAVAALKAVLHARGSPSARVAAAIHILERNHGKVPQPIEARVEETRDYQVTIKLVEGREHAPETIPAIESPKVDT
jgi:hypothetical protein